MSKLAAAANAVMAVNQLAGKKEKGENVKVVVRCRPLNSVEREANDAVIVHMDPKLGSIRVQQPDSQDNFKTFTFDSVYPPGTTQKFIFDDCCKPIIDSVLNGYNGTLFCYGQTGTGKTFTMEGVVDDEPLRGMMPQSFYYTFAGLEAQGKNMEFLVRGSFLEIYKDDVYDLLNSKMRTRMEVKESPDKGVFVKDLSTFTVKSPEDLLKILKVGQKQRKVGATKMNEGSSRSHSILTITIESSEKSTDKDGQEAVSYKVGKLNMVDLAGSERQKKTEAQGDRLDEAKSINWSLTVLGNVIKALVEPNSKHVPYRDSKLTRLLQDSLGGNTKTVMCANCGPAAPNFEETISTLRYADRAKQIKNKPVVNEDPKDTMLREMQDEISRLKAMLEARKNGGVVPPMLSSGALDALGQGHPQSTEGEHMLGMDAIQGDNVVEEIVEKEVIEDTGIKPEDLEEIKRLAAEEHAKLVEQHMAANKSEEEARALAEEATADYQRELTRKAEILAKENAQLENMARLLDDKEKQLQKGGAALDAAQRKKEQLRRTEEELSKRRAEQERMVQQMREAEEARVLMVEQYTNAGEELRAKTAKLKSLWGMYQTKKASLLELQEEFDLERNDLLDTIRSLDRQIKLKALIMEEFIPPPAAALIESHATYDHGQDAWSIPGVEYAGNNVQRSEMMFGGGGAAGGGGLGLMMGGGGGGGTPAKRSFKRDAYVHLSPGMAAAGGGAGPMAVSGMAAVASPSRALFLNYAQFVQAKAAAGDEDGSGGGGERKEKKKKSKSKARGD